MTIQTNGGRFLITTRLQEREPVPQDFQPIVFKGTPDEIEMEQDSDGDWIAYPKNMIAKNRKSIEARLWTSWGGWEEEIVIEIKPQHASNAFWDAYNLNKKDVIPNPSKPCSEDSKPQKSVIPGMTACPLCGCSGKDMVFKFECSNSGCKNFTRYGNK